MLDVKLPIGLMFTLLGGLLLLYGVMTFADEEVYRKALGVNINLWSGSGMLVFGLTLLAFSRWKVARALRLPIPQLPRLPTVVKKGRDP